MREYHPLGALPTDSGTRFHVWAPKATRVAIVAADGAEHALERGAAGVFGGLVPELRAGDCYRVRLDDGPAYPDPASRFQPEGVHGPSEVVDPAAFAWGDTEWAPPPLREWVLYELHVGTFTTAGTFAAAAARLPELVALGASVVELMPVADFPGERNWGYDPAAFWAPSRAYGRPDHLRALVDEAHRLGLAVILDVVYNHFGPDGAYITAFGPCLTTRHKTPWGAGVNLDGSDSAGVRAFFLANARHWLLEYHLDGFRLDAIDRLVDTSPQHFLAEVAEMVAELPGPRRQVIGEDERNLASVVRPREAGGAGLDAVWSSDFHHLVQRRLCGDDVGYFADYPADATAQMAALAKAIERGWWAVGEHSVYRRRPRGTDPSGLPPEAFVFCLQNHDEVGNRPLGERLHHAVSRAEFRAVSALLLFCPQIPLLFMGQEWATARPFHFFADHEEALGQTVRRGRERDFVHFPAVTADPPDPQAVTTYIRSQLDWGEREREPHASMLRLYRDLLARRRALAEPAQVPAVEADGMVVVRGRDRLLLALSETIVLPVPEEAEIVWHSENPAYATNPHPMAREDGRVRFRRPGAAWARSR